MKPLSYILFIALVSCGYKTKYPYSISDFSSSLRPELEQIVTAGQIPRHFNENISDKELLKLTSCEHPVIRAWALNIAIQRKSIDSYSLMMSHLDDTAYVDEERGKRREYVSDFLIDNFVWQDSLSRIKTIDKVLLDHNYLRSAYRLIRTYGAQSKYYFTVKQMAKRPFGYASDALYVLASFKKKDDTPFIHSFLERAKFSYDYNCFAIMRDFPDTLYLKYLKIYKRTILYNNFLHGEDGNYLFEKFVDCIARYKNEESCKMLEEILSRKPLIPFDNPGSFALKDILARAIWNNQCPTYANLMNKTEALWEREKGIPIITYESEKSAPIRWAE